MATGNEIRLPLTSPGPNAGRLLRLREVFPDAFTEGKIDFDKLSQAPGGCHGRVKMIYIDPPYNTGGDFVYPDNYKEGLAD